MKQILKKTFTAIAKYIGVILMFTVILTSLGILFSGFIVKEVLAYKDSVLAEYDIDKYVYEPALTTQIYSKQGTLLAEVYDENRRYIPYSEIPDNVKDALIAVEDRRFYEHHGVDPKGLGRALVTNFTSGNATGQGASTLTQQISKLLFLSSEKTYERKLKELFISFELESKYDKNKILEIYLNEVFFGNGAYGIESAARSYFGKTTQELTLAEATLLVGLPQSPSTYNPVGKNGPERALKRQKAVLDSMVNEGMITKEEAREIVANPPVFKETKQDSTKITSMKYPYFTSWVINELKKDYGEEIISSGWNIYTTIDDSAQLAAIEVAHSQSQKFGSTYGMHDIAITTIDPTTGELVAMTSGNDSDFADSQINMSTRPRQPGSTIKPLVFAAGIEKGVISDSTILKDEAIDINGYKPKNYNMRHEGYMTTREAMRTSNNIVSVKVGQRTGIKTVRDYIQKMGVTSLTDKDQNLGMMIGGLSKGISPYEMAIAYGVFANGGELVTPHYISKIENQKGKVMHTFKGTKERVLSKETAHVMTDMLRDVIEFGTGTSARIGVSTAGKTGTTNSNVDLWHVGYAGNFVTSVWVGNADNSKPKHNNLTSGVTASATFSKYMSKYIQNKSIKSLPSRIGLVTETLYVTGDDEVFLAGKYCSGNIEGEIITTKIQAKYLPTESKDCTATDTNQYLKNLISSGETITSLVEKGYYQDLINGGFIRELVNAGFFAQLAKEGHIDKLKSAGYEKRLIDEGFIEKPKEEPKEEEPVENPTEKPNEPTTPPTNNGNGSNNGNGAGNGNNGGGTTNPTTPPVTNPEPSEPTNPTPTEPPVTNPEQPSEGGTIGGEVTDPSGNSGQ